MAKKTYTQDYALIPVAWLERLIELAEQEGTTAQHIKGYVSSAEVLINNAKRLNPQDIQAIYTKLEKVIEDIKNGEK